MGVPKIAINGFGRIGRIVTRIAKLAGSFNVVAINDITPPESLCYAFKYDSIHGTYPGEVGFKDGVMNIDDDHFLMFSERKPANLPWKELEVDYVVEASGQFRRVSDLQQHLDAGAQRVIVTVPTKDYLESTVVMGVNDHVLTKDARIVSNASCTTNCAAPIVKVLHEAFGVERGLLNTIHAYTSDQRLIDASHTDLRRSRNAATNIIPTSTGAAKAIGKVIPELEGKLDGLAMRVPVPDGSVIDLSLILNQNVSVDKINAVLHKAAEGELKGILEYSTQQIVSSDIVRNTHSSIYDSLLTQVVGGNFVKIISWYDNEWGYSSRINDLISHLAEMDGIT